MADLKENELAQKKDFNYVRALDASGNSILINKADFTKVLEELMKPLCEKKYAATVDEKDKGIYVIGVDLAPTMPGKNTGCLIVFSTAAFRGMQLFVPDTSSGAIYTRCFMNKEFTAWKSISLADI